MTLAYATHRLSGVASPANAAYNAAELTFQLQNSGAKALFTVSRLGLVLEHFLIFKVCSTYRNCPGCSQIIRDPKGSSLPS